MKIKKVVLFHKKSAYSIHYFKNGKARKKNKPCLPNNELSRLQVTHDEHYGALAKVEKILKKRKISYQKICRGKKIPYPEDAFIIAVGGDGTFLEAARCVKNQVILGVNSSPDWSVGRFCGATADSFNKKLDQINENEVKPIRIERLKIELNDTVLDIQAVNDILICHTNPAAMSRYYLTVNRVKEEQSSSGIWISTASGSTGAINSAGGKILPRESKAIQYKTRELYPKRNIKYRLTGAVLRKNRKVDVSSLMHEGMMFIDGAHVQFPFSYCDKVHICSSSQPLRVIF